MDSWYKPGLVETCACDMNYCRGLESWYGAGLMVETLPHGRHAKRQFGLHEQGLSQHYFTPKSA